MLWHSCLQATSPAESELTRALVLLLKFDYALQSNSFAAGWQSVVRRGGTATSLSIPGHYRTEDCLPHAMNVLRSEGFDICMCHMGNIFPELKQMTIGRRCVTEASNPSLYDSCKDCHDAILLQLHFDCLLSKVRVCSSSLPAQPTSFV